MAKAAARKTPSGVILDSLLSGFTQGLGFGIGLLLVVRLAT
jgi:hypothetical protein